MKLFLQSPLWADLLRSQQRTVLERVGSGWHYLAVVEHNSVGKILYAPYGPVAEGAQQLAEALDSLRREAKSLGAICARVEPVEAGSELQQLKSQLLSQGLRRAPADQQPELSWLIDLSQDEKTLLGQMRASNRNIYRNIAKKGVTLRSTREASELPELLNLLHETALRNGFKPQSDSYLQQVAELLMPAGAATLYLAEFEGRTIAAALVYDTEDTRVYAHAAVSWEHRKLSAGIPLMVQLILDARRAGLHWIDLWGVAPEGQTDHKWSGFTAFKTSFGGFRVERPGTWDLPVGRARYLGYRFARSAQRKLRQAKAQLRRK